MTYNVWKPPGEQRKRFMLHYNFPRFPWRSGPHDRRWPREIGHGALAERAIAAVLPGEDESPYTLRVVPTFWNRTVSRWPACVAPALP